MKVNKVNKVVELNKLDIIKYQLFTYCYFEKIPINENRIICLALLSIWGEKDFIEFCDLIANEKLFATSQVVRNTVGEQEKQGLIIVEGKLRNRIIKINPNIPLITEGNILLDFKILYRESS